MMVPVWMIVMITLWAFGHAFGLLIYGEDPLKAYGTTVSVVFIIWLVLFAGV